MPSDLPLVQPGGEIKLSDAILVVNVGGYIGSATRDEIEYAEALGNEILYYTDLVE